ncbi:MAG: hypothetical protein IJS00_05705 [Paludibacteraceae bacterium]|nr:hypothetical protein [Paludibacteraceae bacterium]
MDSGLIHGCRCSGFGAIQVLRLLSSFSSLFNIDLSHSSLHLILPLGISFFTFQAISYIIDAYRCKLPNPPKMNISSLIECLLYIGFFPKLLAGPIERPSHLLPQIAAKRTFSYDKGLNG